MSLSYFSNRTNLSHVSGTESIIYTNQKLNYFIQNLGHFETIPPLKGAGCSQSIKILNKNNVNYKFLKYNVLNVNFLYLKHPPSPHSNKGGIDQNNSEFHTVF
jgi:hypothetical protein